ncbi:MAG: recombination mediator RecR [Patescibacteria group bacterium]|nr:recombination mediator RecR [Patescibacteria group bacterium]
MTSLPLTLKKISHFLERLPGIGEKTANRLAFYLLRMPENDLKDFANMIASLKSKIKLCSSCFNFTEEEKCEICLDKKRDQGMITVVESVLDLLSLEKGGIYQGIYHVLHGRIDPLNNIRPEDIYIEPLIKRIKNNKEIKEIILATNPDMEGEATAIYIREKIKNQFIGSQTKIKITRLAYGLPIGANLEYADYMTLKKAIEGRNEY